MAKDTALQTKLNKMLADCIKDVEGLGITLYDIIPEVRITNNKHCLGSAQDMNKSLIRKNGKTVVRPGMKPLFRISITRLECDTDEAIKNVLYHEVLHCAPDCQNHGKQWKAYAKKVNIKFGTNVTTTKKEEQDTGDAKAYTKSDVKKFIGKCFKDGTRTFEFTGMNDRPKNCCEIKDVKSGRKYICSVDHLGHLLETSQYKFVTSVAASIPPLPTDDSDYSSWVGKKAKNGSRGRKTFTVKSVDPSRGGKAVMLEDENGREYHGGIGVLDALVLL